MLLAVALGSEPLVMAQLPALPPGEHEISAEYGGDPSFAGSASPPIVVSTAADGAVNRVRRRLQH